MPPTTKATNTNTPSKETSSPVTNTAGPSSGGGNEAGQSPGQGPLPTGAIVGISVGSAVGVILLALGAFLLYRRKQRRRVVCAPSPSIKAETPAQKEVYQLNAEDAPHLLDPQDPRPGANPVWELHG